VTLLDLILLFAATVVGAGLLGVVAWAVYSLYLTRLERNMARRKGAYRQFLTELSSRDLAFLEPELKRVKTLRDFEALEALLEEQARTSTGRPGWLLDAYDRLGLVDKYIERLRHARKWRERAFAAELLGRVGSAKAVPPLLETVQATRTEDADVREIALRALARIADPQAVGPLVEALKQAESWLAPRIADILVRHGEAVVEPMLQFLAEGSRHPARAWAANVLGEVRAQRAFPALVRALGDMDDEVRAKAAGALGKLGDRRAVTYLLDHLLSDPAPFVRARIAGALGQFGDREVVDRLVRALGDPAWWVRMRSVEALEQIGRSAEGPLVLALDDPDPEIRIRAAVALERLGVPARLVEQIERGTERAEAEELLAKFGVAGARELLAELLHHPAASVRLAVIRAARAGVRQDLSAELLERGRRDADPAVRAAAFEALRALGARDVGPAALEALADADQQVRAAAIALLGDVGGAELGALLLPRAGDPEPLVRAAAARALGLVGAAGAEAAFERLLRDPVPAVRAAAAEGAATAGWRGAVPRLMELLEDSDDVVRQSAAAALGALGDPVAVPALVKAFRRALPPVSDAILHAVARLDSPALAEIIDILLEREDVPCRVGVVRTLASLKPPYPERLVESLFLDRAPEVRAAAAELLGRLESERSAELLEGGLRDPDETVRARVVDALVRRHRAELGPTVMALLEHDPSPVVRERAALATGLFRVPGGEVVLLKLCRPEEPLPVRAAACLAIGAYDQESIVARVLEMADEVALRDLLRERLKHDAEYRLLGLRLREARHVELRALGSASREEMERVLAEGMRGVLSPAQRVRLVAGLRAFQGERSRSALLAVLRSDPSPEVRAAALTAVGGMLDAGELELTATRALADPHHAVRHAAVALFYRVAPDQALPSLLRLLRAEEDPVVLQTVAQLAEAAFPTFMDLALGVDASGEEAVLITRVARYMHHPELRRVVSILGRSEAPQVRAAVADLWAARPEFVDEEVLEALAVDPEVAVRRAAVGAWAGCGRFDRLAAMLGDPDPGVRQDIALAFRAAPDSRPLDPLLLDPDESVRAALFAVRLLRGEVSDPPAAFRVSRQAAAAAIRRAAAVADLRDAARTERDLPRRQAAALALAVLDDEAAYAVMRTDPIWAVRDRVGRMLAGWQEVPDARRPA
jgi:HEAT repeat protein